MTEQMTNVKITDICDEMKENFLTYAEYVICDRAIPDVRDGLKPVHRRVLWAMWNAGYKSNSPYRKSARIVGEVIGKFHPHGDGSAYESMVRLAQPFVLNNVLVDGKGNFGSVDGSPAAAYRYTEARLHKFAEAVYFADIGEQTVRFIDNYDGLEKEPVVLPARIPMILLTASSGIAVGMATDIAPHNLNEVCDATLAFLDNPTIDVAKLCRIIQGPDIPLGGVLKSGGNGTYEHGRGTFLYRVLTEFETEGKSKSIIIKSIPYATNKENILQEVAAAINDGKVDGIKEIRDESDKKGIRICIEVAPRADHTAVLNSLFRHTRLQCHMKFNAVAICKNQPRNVGLREVLSEFITFRREVVRKRTAYRKEQAESRKEIVDGMLVANAQVALVIEIVRNGRDADKTVTELQSRIKLTKRQAEHVFNMPLRRLSKMDCDKLDAEQKELTSFIVQQDAILKDKAKVDEVIHEEVKEIQKQFGNVRRTHVVTDFGSIEAKDTVKQQIVALIFMSDGTVKSTPIDDYRVQQRRGRGVSGVRVPDGVVPVHVAQANTHDDVMVFTDQGNRYRLAVHLIPALDRSRKPQSLQSYIPEFQQGERVVSVTESVLDDDESLVMLGSKGKLCRMQASIVNRTRDKTTKFYPVDAGGKLVSAVVAKKDADVVIVTKMGRVLRTAISNIREVASRESAGAQGIRFAIADDEALSASVAYQNGYVLTITQRGVAKRTALEHYPKQGRGCTGVIGVKLMKGDYLVFGQVIVPDEDTSLFAITNQNIAIRTRFTEVSEQGRAARGTAIKRLEQDEYIASVAVE